MKTQRIMLVRDLPFPYFHLLLSSLSRTLSVAVLLSSSPAQQGFPLSQPQEPAEPRKPTGKASFQATSMQHIQQQWGPGGFWTSLRDQHAQGTASPLSLLGHSSSDTAPAASINVLEPLGALDHSSRWHSSWACKAGEGSGSKAVCGVAT